MFKKLLTIILLAMTLASAHGSEKVFDKEELANEEKNLFGSLIMANYESGLSDVCVNGEKCLLAISQIRCSFPTLHGEITGTGACSYKNRDGDLGVLEGRYAETLVRELVKYGAEATNNGRELKLNLKIALCLATPLAEKDDYTFTYKRQCQLRK